MREQTNSHRDSYTPKKVDTRETIIARLKEDYSEYLNQLSDTELKGIYNSNHFQTFKIVGVK